MSYSRHELYYEEPLPLFNAQALGATRTSRTFSTAGYNTCTLFVHYDDNAGTTTAVTFYLEIQPENDSTNWYRLTDVAVTAGTGTRTDYIDSFATAAADQDYVLNFALTPGAHRARLVAAATGSGATDLLTVRYVLSAARA